MIFLPNKYERYSSALRNYLQKICLKNRNNKNLVKKIIKIQEFEAMFINNNKFPCNVKLLSSKLLIFAYSRLLEKNKNLDFKIEIKNNFMLNIKLYTILILKLAKTSEFINIKENQSRIYITCNTTEKINLKLLNKLNAKMLYETKNNILLIVIDSDKTNKKSVEIKEEWDISNPFSPVNLYLS